ncbi:DNA topoisomerase 2 [Venturia nashicola]|nr:DNA topoisomerase 2 [Venturia nashicola]
MSQYGYTIRRLTAPGEPVDLCAPLEFFPPKGSDELHEALKLAFPFEPTLQARMRQAVINFHLSEAQADIVQSSFVQDEYLPSPESSFVDNVTSPTMSAPSRQDKPTSRSPSHPPAQEELMDVWCLPSLPAAKIHTRRNMTAEEKKAYKAKRLAGACADCKRRRRKCDHDSSNQTGTSSKRVVKTRKRSAIAKSPPVKPCAAPPSSSSTVTSAVAVQDSFTFAPQDNFLSFDSGFNISITNDMSFSMGIENVFGNDVGFDLKNDFDLFPDTATNPGLSSAGMDATSWLAGSSPDTRLNENQFDALSRSFNSWPVEGEPLPPYNTAGVPLTPQSLSPPSLMMSRSQSGHSSSSSSLSSVFGGNNAVGFHLPVFDQGLGKFVLHSPQSIMATPDAASRPIHRTLAGATIPSQQFASTWSPQDMLDPPTTRFQPRSSRGSTSSSEPWPAASWVGRGLLNHNSPDHVSDLAANLDCSDQCPAVSSNNGSSISSSSSRTTAANSSRHSLAPSIQYERAHPKSTDPGRTLPPDLGAADGNVSTRRTSKIIPRATASSPEQQPQVQFIRPSNLAKQSAEDTGRDASTAHPSKRRSMRMIGRTGSSEHLRPGAQPVQFLVSTGQAGPIKNANRVVLAQGESTRRSTRLAPNAISSEQNQQSGLHIGGISIGSHLIDSKNFKCLTPGLNASQRKAAKATSSGHSSSANMQQVLSSALISQPGYLETSDCHTDMSKLCRLKHSSAAADDVCSALQSSFDLPSLDGLASVTIVSGAHAFKRALLLIFVAIQLFRFCSTSFSGLDENVRANKSIELVVANDSSKETKDMSMRATTRDAGALQKHLQPHHRSFQRAFEQHPNAWQFFSDFMQPIISRLGGKKGKTQFNASRIC